MKSCTSAVLIVVTLFAFNLVQTCEALSLKSGSSPHLLHRNGDHSEVKHEELKMFLHRAEECRSNPDTCADSIDEMTENSNRTEEQIIDEVNETEEEFENFTREFKSCETTQIQSADDKSGTFSKMNDDHTTCRKTEEEKLEAHETCQELVQSKQTIADTKCGSETLTEAVSDLAEICEPSTQQPLGTWLRGMSTTFKEKYDAWVVADEACEEAKESVINTTRDCDVKKEELTNHTAKCDQELGNLETFACTWATSIATGCSAYETCYTSTLTRYNAAASELPALEARWNETWQSAERMKCLAAAVDSEGVVDKDKMETCDEVANTTHLTVKVARAPAETTCPEPEIYPGSAKFKELVYSNLPPGLPVREPTLCLTWKQKHCAAHSSFGGSIVKLQTDEGYCGVTSSGKVHCGDTSVAPCNFTFQHDGTDCTGRGTLTVHFQGKDLACKHDPSADRPYLSCSGNSIVPGASPAEADFIVNGMATGRSGMVTLKFAGTTTGSFYGANAADSGTTDELMPFAIDGGGAATSLLVKDVATAEGGDRTFKIVATQAAPGMPPFGSGSVPHHSLHGPFNFPEVSCPEGFAMCRLDSTFSLNPPRRVFSVYCRSIPAGYSQQSGSWSGWSGNSPTEQLACPAGSVIQGIRTSNQKAPIQEATYSISCVALSFVQPVPLTLKVEFISA